MSSVRKGTVIAGKYRIERPLSRGGMGSVWRARHLQLDAPVAVKIMLGELAATEIGRARFEREAKSAALIQSANVVHIRDYGVDGDTPYIVMELLEGEDLRSRLQRARRLPLPTVIALVAQVSRALRRAHEAGIVHRDLKPANLFLVHGEDDEEIVKVLDFGIAKSDILGSAGESTATGMLLGSVHYMSPEQARGARDVDHRADLWSLTVIAYRALVGQLPFPGEQVGDVIVKICADPIPPPSSIEPELGLIKGLDAFFARAFTRDPAGRYQSARELATALAALGGLGVDPMMTSARLPLPSFALPALTPLPLHPARLAIGMPASLPPPPSSPSSATPLPASTRLSRDPPTQPSAEWPTATGGGTLTSAASDPDPHRRAPSARLLAAAAGALVLALVGALVVLRSHPAPTPASASAEPASTPSALAAPPPPPVEPPSAIPSVVPSAPAAVESAAPLPSALASAPRSFAPRPKGPAKRINRTLGF